MIRTPALRPILFGPLKRLVSPGVIVLAVCSAGVALAWTGWTRAVTPARQKQTASASWVVAPLSETHEVIEQRHRARERVVDRLLARELTLLESAAWFRYLNDNPAECRSDFRTRTPGGSDGEKACRQVIAHVQGRLGSQVAAGGLSASQATFVLSGLEEELDSLCAHSDTIELPW
jgi:hypothetical protein